MLVKDIKKVAGWKKASDTTVLPFLTLKMTMPFQPKRQNQFEEALIRKAKRDMYLRKIKAVQEGNLEGLEGIIAEIIAAIADSKE